MSSVVKIFGNDEKRKEMMEELFSQKLTIVQLDKLGKKYNNDLSNLDKEYVCYFCQTHFNYLFSIGVKTCPGRCSINGNPNVYVGRYPGTIKEHFPTQLINNFKTMQKLCISSTKIFKLGLILLCREKYPQYNLFNEAIASQIDLHIYENYTPTFNYKTDYMSNRSIFSVHSQSDINISKSTQSWKKMSIFYDDKNFDLDLTKTEIIYPM